MSSGTAKAVISSVCAVVAVVITIAVIRRCRHARKKMHKKIVAKIMEEMSKKHRHKRGAREDDCAAFDDVVIEIGPVEKFLHEILNEKPMRFSSDQLACYTSDYSTELGSGGFGVVYKGELPNGLQVAVKVLKVSMNKKVQEGFMAEIGTIGRTYHVHLVRLYGFCFDRDGTRALVYEFLEKRLAGEVSLPRQRRRGREAEGEAGVADAAQHRRRYGEGDPVPARGVPAEDRALRHQAGQHPPHFRLRAEGGRLRAGQARERENTHMSSLTGGGRGRPGTRRRSCGWRCRRRRSATCTASAWCCSRSWAAPELRRRADG
ncbi:hypothetical protein ACQ4PT_060611 [Festuca glaucescens]